MRKGYDHQICHRHQPQVLEEGMHRGGRHSVDGRNTYRTIDRYEGNATEEEEDDPQGSVASHYVEFSLQGVRVLRVIQLNSLKVCCHLSIHQSLQLIDFTAE